MGDIIIFILLIVLVFLIVPIITLAQINSLKNEIRSLNRKVNDLLMSKPIPDSEAAPEVRTVDINVETEIIPDRYAAYMPPKQEEYNSDLEIYPEPDFQEEEAFPEIVPDVVDSTPIHESAYMPRPLVKKYVDERNIFEKLLGTNWLSKIGIITLVLGIGFFVKYAIDQEWINEIGRVGIGLFIGALIIGIAHKLKANYQVFSSILVGGGISVFYITITLAFREYELFSQTVAFVMLISITVFSVLLSLLYNRKELAIFSLLGGFAAPLMISTGAGNYIVLFSYILILNTGMLVVSFIKKWRIIGIISYALTVIFFWTWTLTSYKNQFFNVSLFVSLFFVQFYLLALFDHFKSDKKISAYQVFLILTNNLSAFVAYLYVTDDYSSDIRGLITISFAVVNAVVMVVLFRKSRIDSNLVYLTIAIVLSFVSLAIPIQLKGHVITMFWAAEAVILLWLWQKSQIKVFYVGFILVSLLTLFSYFMDINKLYSYSNTMAVMSNRLFITGIVVLVSFIVSMLLLKREPAGQGRGKLPVRLFKILIIAFAYIVPFLELNIQLEYYTDNLGASSFRYVVLATFTTIYIAALAIIYNKKVSSENYIFGLLYIVVCLFAVYQIGLITDLRHDIFEAEKYPAWYFFYHLLSLPAITYIIYLLVKNIRPYFEGSTWLSWLLTILVVVILSIETDNIVVWMFAGPNNYYGVLYDVHTFGYPILWGIIAMILMIWGLNGKEALLRKISLVFFGLIIVKFYAYDVWKMSQMGRIFSFVMLGVILLLVSFLQQKIRTLVKNDDKPEIVDDNNEQQLTDNNS